MSLLLGALGRSATYVTQVLAGLPFLPAATPPAPSVRRVERTGTLHLPARTLTAAPDTSSGAAGDLLTIWSGGPDEPPEGPNGFGVLADGSLLVTDPLAKRLMLYTPQGILRKSIPLGFPADSLRVGDEDAVWVREATTGEEYPVPGFHAPGTAVPAPLPKVALASAQSATLAWPANAGHPERVLRLTLDDPNTTLLSVECLKVELDLTTYVALELTDHDESSDAIHLRKDVRRYNGAGQLVCEVADLPLGYFIAPVDELRVQGDTLYQLMTTPSEVLINLWRTNPAA